MARDEERFIRSQEAPIVGGLPEVPAVLIAAAFSMYNRMVEGFRVRTLPSADAYGARASEIAAHGYSDQRVTSVPR